MEISEDEWQKIKSWLNNYRVFCKKEADRSKHEKIAKSHITTSRKVRDFINEKEIIE